MQEINELISAEIIFSSKDLSTHSLESEYENELEALNKKLNKYTNESDKTDYILAISSGILCGLLDSLFVGDFSISNANSIGDEKVEGFVKDVALKVAQDKNDKMPSDMSLSQAIRYLEKKFEIPADKATSGFGGGLQHHLRDFTHHPSPIGLICSILTQFTGTVYGTNTSGEFNRIKLSDDELLLLGKNIPEKIAFGTINWFFHLVSDMAGSSGSVAKGSLGTGIPGPMLSFFKELSALPLFKKTDEKGNKEFSVFVSKLFNGTLLGNRSENGKIQSANKFDLRTEIGIGIKLAKQSVPVLLNECIVRSFYFFRRLYHQVKELNITRLSDLKLIKPDKILPFSNRTITRMTTISSITFSSFDMLDATVRAAVASAGNAAVFGVKFFSRLNYVGIGRVALSVVSETKMEFTENVLLREKLLLVENHSKEEIRILDEIKNKIENLVNQYISEDIEAFLSGIDIIETGIKENNSDMIIRGSVSINRVMGKTVQYSNQQEFDSFMLSDESFIF